MKVHLINPSHSSFGTAVITPRWMYVIAAATPASFGDPLLVDETIDPIDPERIQSGDVVGISIHTENALRGYTVGKMARERGAFVIFGGIHATLYPEESRTHGEAHGVVLGDGELVWPTVLADCSKGTPQATYLGGRVEGSNFQSARWDLVPRDKYMFASVQTVRGCPKHCSFCSVWKTDGQRPRQRPSDAVIDEIVQLRRLGFRFIALADDNFYPVTLTDLQLASRQGDTRRLEELKSMRAERFELMERLEQLPSDMIFFTQITMEAAEDPSFLDAMRKANIKGALVGVEAVTPEGLKDIYKDFNSSGQSLVERLQTFRRHNVHVLGSFIFGLPSDRPETFEATAALAQSADITFAQFVMLTPFPGTVDFAKWEKKMEDDGTRIAGHPLTRRWLIPQRLRLQDVLASPAHVGRGNPATHPGRLGPFLQPEFRLETLEFHQVAVEPHDLRFDLQALPANVCQYRHGHRQRTGRSIHALGAVDCKTMPLPLFRSSHAPPYRAATEVDRSTGYRIDTPQRGIQRDDPFGTQPPNRGFTEVSLKPGFLRAIRRGNRIPSVRRLPETQSSQKDSRHSKQYS